MGDRNKAPTNKICNRIKHLPTRFATVSHWRDTSASAYERDLVTNEKIWFQSSDPDRTFEKSFFPSRFLFPLQEKNRGKPVEFAN